MAKILVTGGAGFIGSNLVNSLIEENHQVVIIDDLSTGEKQKINKKAKFFHEDILNDLSAIFQREQFDYVVHEAAQMNIRKSIEDPFLDSRVNIEGSINVMENCRKYAVKKIVFASSGGAVYGDTQDIPTPENHPLKPASPYGLSKDTVESYLQFYGDFYKLPSVSLRYANVYGPGQNPAGEAGVVAIFTQQLLNGKRPTINGNGTKTRDFVYVEDVVKATIRCLKSEKVGIYNVGTGTETSIGQIFEMIKAAVGTNTKPIYGSDILGEQQRSSLDFSKIHKDFGWSPETSLEDGIKKTVEYFRKISP